MSSFGGTVKLTGESEYRKALSEISSTLRVLNSEMRSVTSQYDKNDRSVENLSSQNQVLNKKIEEQEKKVALLREAMERSAAETGENSAQTQRWQTELNNAQADLNKLNRELSSNADALREAERREAELEQQSKQTNSGVKGFAKTLLECGAGTKSLGDVIKGSLYGRLNELKANVGENVTKVKDFASGVGKIVGDMKSMGVVAGLSVAALKLFKDEMKETGKETEKTGEEEEETAEKTEKFGEILKANLASEVIIGGVKAIASGIASMGRAMIGFGKDVVNAFGELEQNLGGSEAVFGEYAGKIQAIGEEAYKNLGISQSDYLATANKMGALFQGSGIEQSRSLELTTQAMQRAADMASVMGIDMSVAMEAVSGAAKGNFTMMDNLGVAMNATNLEAYALEKGLDFCWNKATQAEKAELAMQMFFEKTSQYAGNFERESTQTISGSIGLLQAAVQSFTAGLGNANADMVNLTQNVVDAFNSVVANVTPIIENIIGVLPSVIETILSAVGELLPMLLETVTTIFGKLLETIVAMLPDLIPVVMEAVMTIVNTLIENLPTILETGIQVLLSLVQGITESLPELIPTIIDAVVLMVETLLDNIDLIIDTGIDLILALADGLLEALPDLVDKIPVIIDKMLTAIMDNLPKILDAGIELTIQLAVGLVEAIPQLVARIPEITAKIIKGLLGAIPQMIKAGGDLLAGLFKGLLNPTTIWNAVKSLFNGIVGGIKELFGIHSPSKVFEDEVGKNLALGLGEGFENTMSDVTDEMANAIPTEFDADINTNMKMATGNTQLSTYDMMVSAFKQALTEVKVVMDDREMGGFVTDTVERVVFA